METIIQWALAHTDPMAIAAAVISFVLGLAFFQTKLVKSRAIARELAELLSTYDLVSEDGKVDSEEASKLWNQILDLVKEIKA